MLPQNTEGSNDYSLERAIADVAQSSDSSSPSPTVVSEILAAVQSKVSSLDSSVERDHDASRSAVERLKRRKNRIFRLSSLAAAVAVLIAVFVFVTQTTQNTALAYEQVVENVKKLRSLSYISKNIEMGKVTQEFRFYSSGNKQRSEVGDSINVEDYDTPGSMHIILSKKTANIFRIDPSDSIELNQWDKEVMEDFDIINQIKSYVDKKYTKLVGEEKFNGKRVDVYHFVDPEYPKERVSVWVNPLVELPVKIIFEEQSTHSQYETTCICDSFKWNEPLDPGLFKLIAPPGFRAIERDHDPDHTRRTSMEETTSGKMKIHVLDVKDRPLANTAVTIHPSTNESNFNNDARKKLYSTHFTDAEGVVEVEFPKTLTGLLILCNRDGYVPLGASCIEHSKSSNKIPESFTFYMQRGTTIGGIITDTSGKPIQNVRVWVTLVDTRKIKTERAQDAQVIYHLTRGFYELSNLNALPCVTDEQGRWSLNQVPSGENVIVKVSIAHDDYLGDKWIGETQKQAKITMKELRAQTARMTMRKGFSVEGTVRDVDGKPLPNAIVDFNAADAELATLPVRTDAEGRYRLSPIEPGKTEVFVVAKDWMPERMEVNLTENLKGFDFQLKRGNELKVRFVDEDKKPITDVGVQLYRWRRKTSHMHDRFADALNEVLPDSTGESNVFEWNWAPEDKVTLDFWKKGYEAVSVKLTADGKEHVQIFYKADKK